MKLSTIVEQCQKGDREAFGQLYTTCRDRLMAICLHYVPDEYVAADLLHDAFLLIISKIHTLKDPSKADTWMQAVVRNVALFYLRQEKQRETFSLDAVRTSAGTVSTQVEPVSYDEMMQQVDALPEGYRQVFRLSVLEGLSHQEIAELLHIQPHTSSSQLFRAKQMLRQSLRVLIVALALVGIYLAMHKDAVPPMHEGGAVAQEGAAVDTPSTVRIVAGDSLPVWHKPQKQVALRADSTKDRRKKEEQPLVAESHDANDSVAVQPTNVQPRPQEEEYVVEERPRPQWEQLPAQRLWTVDLAFSGMPNRDGSSLPDGQGGMNGDIDSTAHHRMPLTIGLSFSRQIGRRMAWSVGISYTQLSSEFMLGNTFLHVDRSQWVRYLDLSVGTRYCLLNSRDGRWMCYGKATAVLGLPLRSTVETSYIYDGVLQDVESGRLQPGRQWSVGASLGLQIDLLRGVGLFAEPGMYYYFDNGRSVKTWNTEHPVNFSVPVGLRFNF